MLKILKKTESLKISFGILIPEKGTADKIDSCTDEGKEKKEPDRVF